MADPAPAAPAPEPAPPAPSSSDPPSEPPPADPPSEPAKEPVKEPTKAEPSKEADDDLGESGKRALDSERSARKQAEKDLKATRAELDELRQAQMSEQEKAVADARRAGETETTDKFHRRLFSAEAKVAAAGRLADPTLLADPDVAQKLLGFDDIPLSGEDIDSEAISGAIDRLIEERPFLKAGEPAHATWPSNGDEAGPRGDAKSQLTRDDLKHMSPQEIVKARADGQLTSLLGHT